MGTAYRNEPVHYNSNTRQSSKLVGFHCASFHSSIFGHFIRLFLYHHLEIFGAFCLGLRIFRRKVSGLELRKTLLRTLKSRTQILKPGSHSFTKSPIYHYIWGAGGKGGTWVNFCWVCATGLSAPLPHYSLFCGQLIIIDPILVTLGQICNFRDPNLVTFYFYELTPFLIRMKNTVFYTGYSTNILVRMLTVNMKNCLTPQKSEKVWPYSRNSIENATPLCQSSWENATPSCRTSSLASYKEAP